MATLTSGKAGGTLFQNLGYSYDDVGNILGMTNAVAVPPASQFGGPVTLTYGYDDLYRLTSASGSFEYQPGKVDQFSLTMTYDGIHNIKSKTQVHEVVQPATPEPAIPQRKTSYAWIYDYTGPQPHAPSNIGQRGFLYDANGNQTGWDHDRNGTNRRIAWDEENRVQTITDTGHTTSYKYNDEGERVIKRGPQGETVYVNQFFTIRNREVGTKHIFTGNSRAVSKLMAQDKPGANPSGVQPREKDLYFYHPDHLGSTAYVTDTEGKLYQHLQYFPFGETWVEQATNTQRTPYRFTGKELDEETALYYYGVRYYDPRTSVWQSADPILGQYVDGAPNSGVFRPINLALHSYTYNNPVNYFDPAGDTPYTFYVRSFSPEKTFGLGWHGDNRGFSRDLDATARIHQRFTLETDTGELKDTTTWSSPSSWLLGTPETETPTASFSEVSQSGSGENRTFSLAASYTGKNPKTPRFMTPGLDVSSSFSIGENRSAGVLSISANIVGDRFPSAEAFIVDPQGVSVFIGVSPLGAGPSFGPFQMLPGEFNRAMINSDFDILLDPEGNFTGVRQNNVDYTIEEWNKQFESQSAK